MFLLFGLCYGLFGFVLVFIRLTCLQVDYVWLALLVDVWCLFRVSCGGLGFRLGVWLVIDLLCDLLFYCWFC